MLRGIFLMSRPPLLREGGEFATLQLNPSKTKPPFVNTPQNIQPAWVLAATRLYILDRIAYPGEIYSHAKIFLTNVQTPGRLRRDSRLLNVFPRLKPGAGGVSPLARLGTRFVDYSDSLCRGL